MPVVAIPGAKYTSGEAPGEGRTHFAALTGTDYTSLDLSGGSYQLNGTDGSTFNLSAQRTDGDRGRRDHREDCG